MINLRSDVRLALFREAAVAFRIKNSEYIIYSEEVSKHIAGVINGINQPERGTILEPLYLDGLLYDEINLNSKSHIYNYHSHLFSGFNSSSWGQRSLSDKDTGKSSFLTDFLFLLNGCFKLKCEGMSALEKMVVPKIARLAKENISIDDTIKNEICRLHRSILWSPFKIACLEWSYFMVNRLKSSGVN